MEYRQSGLERLRGRESGKTDVTLRDGEILRFHAEGENTGEMVSLLHPQLKEEGYEAVTVSQMIVKENYFMETDGRQIPESQNKAIFS